MKINNFKLILDGIKVKHIYYLSIKTKKFLYIMYF